jgi:hypothetical protein
MAVNSCIFDPEKAEKPQQTCTDCEVFKPLTLRDNVLINLQLAYVQRNLEEYQKLLDNAFVFHFSAADFSSGAVEVEQWFIESELASARNMFNPDFQGAGAPISRISLTLNYPKGEDAWGAQPAPPEYPDEIWYEKTVDYVMTVEAGETTFTSGGPISASYLLRPMDVDGVTFYRIVAWRDDI